jgi:hypothetical protein
MRAGSTMGWSAIAGEDTRRMKHASGHKQIEWIQPKVLTDWHYFGGSSVLWRAHAI